MSLVEFKPPEWLDGVNAKSIHKNMMDNLPADIDDTEGGFIWDLTYPTALEKAEILQFHLLQTLKIMHPMWATGRWLDYHAKWGAGLIRKAANKSYGIVTITGTVGKLIPAGFVFSVPADGNAAAIDFATMTAAEIPQEGIVDVEVLAVVEGKGGNVSADTITIMREPIRGISKVTNQNAITGGTEAESDDSLRQRLDEALAGGGDSFVGNDADYVRWSKEVPGVGQALVRAEWAGAGTVKVVLIDANGYPANEQIVNAVYQYIISPNDRLERLAPIGAIVTVAAPTEKKINYSFRLKLKNQYEQESVLIAFKEALIVYYLKSKEMNLVKYIHVAAILSEIDGVDDFSNFKVNDGVENIVLEIDEYPVTDNIEATLWVV